MAKEIVNSGFWSKARPYSIVIFGYAAALLIFILIFDNFVMPYAVNSNEKVKVPSIVGKDIEIANSELERANLESRVIKETYSEKYAQGFVLTQTPNPGSMVKTGRPILVTISKGKEKVSVPYLIGTNLRNARVNLMQRGLELGEITYQFNENYSKDTIFSQNKQAGSFVPYGSKVDIVISKGSELQNRIPMLIGYSMEEINAVIAESGFILGAISYRVSETYLPNTVIDQNPKPEMTAPPGTPINIVVSK